MLSGPEMWPLYGVETWPQIRNLSTILNGHAVGTDVNVRYRQGGRTLEVVVKRGSTVMTNKIDLSISSSHCITTKHVQKPRLFKT